MKIKIQNILYRLQTSFWLLPAVITLAAIGLAYLTTRIDHAIAYRKIVVQWWIYNGGPAGARTVLSVIASSMITVAGVVFSITIVVLTLASSQFGPRLIRNFMNVKSNQMVLGTFVATFVYCILVLCAVNGLEGKIFVPRLSITVAILMSLMSLGVLIYFIHNVAESIQAQNIISRVRNDLDDTVKRIFPEDSGGEDDASPEPIEGRYNVPTTCDREACPIPADHSGYLQAIDNDALMEIAIAEDLLVHIGYRPGQFITRGAALVTLWPGNKVNSSLSRRINAIFIVGAERTLEQDVEFAISQLVEIAVHALSPGINDPITAITCIDWLGAGLCQMANRDMPPTHHYDERHHLRIIREPFTFEGMVDAAFSMIRQNAQSVAAVSIHLLETLSTIAAQTQRQSRRATLLRHTVLVAQGCRDHLSTDDDRRDFDQRYQAAVELLSGPATESA